MLNLKSTLFFGYHKATVNKLIEEMKQEKESLQDKLAKQEKVIDELQTQLTIQKNKENLISDVLLETKRTAHQTLVHAQEQAELHMRNMYERLDRNVSQVQEKIASLEELNEQLLGFEHKMKQELREALEKQMQSLENIDLNAYESIKKEVSVSVETSQEIIDSARKIIEFPTQGEKKTDLEVELEEEIPVFMMSN